MYGTPLALNFYSVWGSDIKEGDTLVDTYVVAFGVNADL